MSFRSDSEWFRARPARSSSISTWCGTPDVAFFSLDRLPGGGVPDDPIPLLVPDLAVEVISKSNTRKEMDDKLREYFEKGVRLVWYVRPRRRVVNVYRGRGPGSPG